MAALTKFKNKNNNYIVPALVACSTLGLLTGCNTIPTKADATKALLAQPKVPISKPFEFTAYDSKTTSDANLSSIAAQRWQNYYKDEKLKELIALGLANNKNLASTLSNIQKAKAQYQITDKSDLPTLGANTGYERSARNALDKNPSSGYNVGLSMANYELDLWGKVASMRQQALQDYLATTAGKDQVQISLVSNIAQLYVNLSYAYAQKQLALATIKTRQQSLKITQARFNAGLDAKTPSLQAASSLENAKLAVYNADTNILKLNNALRLLVGTSVPDTLLPKPAVTNITNHDIFSTGLPSELLRYRPDVLQAEYNLKSAGANIEVARAKFFPSISLSGKAGVASGDLDNLFKSSAFSWSFGPSISVPIFDAGQLDANYQVAKIQQQQALTNYESSIQTAFKEVSDVLADRANLEQRLTSQYKLQSSFKQTYNIANARFKAGLDNYLSVLDAERSMFNAQQSIFNIEQAKVISQIELYEALGGGVDLDTPILLKTPTQKRLFAFNQAGDEQLTIEQSKPIPVISKSTARVITEQETIDYLNKK